ncbi:protein phosphatases PP1 regulatory subunit sds22 [Cordyceps fumosorosea ARSEF 2679]|uniref:Ferulic acid decarboxylase 1 n=1 Tax=Cordyceps fumosorosea (strain ARSEF 2679) TaxID=1081104 RepID=A0A167NXY0_CORFA|nr:protein phosphatases PP1 regulatory subunit sds22 [Cordyceps fumosorosea ARSEF 2679]OAA56068.1 protein phosphatases PP1 regulatory subunit sds22 [Cordyceps fumosorosea ARSEF 2679]
MNTSPAMNFRAFVDYLRDKGELVDVERPVDPNLEAAAIIRHALEIRAKAPLFHNVIGAKDGFFRIMGGMGCLGTTEHSKFGRVAAHLGLPMTAGAHDIMAKMLSAKTLPPIPPTVVPTGPCKENKLHGDQIDLNNIPAPMTHDGDGGKYIQTYGFHVVQSPDGKWTSWSLQRAHVYDSKHLIGLAVAGGGEHNGSIFEQWKALGKDMPWALVLGAPPAALMASSMPLPENVSEGEYIGAVMGEPIDVVKCETNGLLVPATAEIVFEGVVSATEKDVEGPYGEMHGYLYPGDKIPDMPLFRVDCITHRDNAILPVCAAGKAVDETHAILGPLIASEILDQTQKAGLPVKAAWCPFESHTVWAVVQIDNAKLQSSPRESKELCDQLSDIIFQLKPGWFIHRVFVVGDDIDVLDFNNVMWAYATRCRPGLDEYLYEDCTAFPLVPMIGHGTGPIWTGGKMISDCLLPIEYKGERDFKIASFNGQFAFSPYHNPSALRHCDHGSVSSVSLPKKCPAISLSIYKNERRKSAHIMSPGSTSEEQQHAHVTIAADAESRDTDTAPEGSSSAGLTNANGWDGKLRIPKSAILTNPEAVSDPEYSDDDNVLPGEEIAADEDLLANEDPDTEQINYTHSRIGSMERLRLDRFQKVVQICLRQNNIQHIEGLDALGETLEDLDLYDNLISHIRGLDRLTKLTNLDLSFNKIKHIKHVNHLTNLRTLYFVANKIKEIENLDGLDQVTSLELGSNRIREIKNLDTLTGIEELWLAKNKITELKNLGGLPRLRLLSIQSNRISDLRPLREVPQLEELYISHNMLDSLEGLEANVNLTTVDVSHNKIDSLKGLGPLKRLEEVWASYNLIMDFADVERELKDKEALTTVYFEGNPLQLRAPALYRNKVRLALPQLKQIDATYLRV